VSSSTEERTEMLPKADLEVQEEVVEEEEEGKGKEIECQSSSD